MYAPPPGFAPVACCGPGTSPVRWRSAAAASWRTSGRAMARTPRGRFRLVRLWWRADRHTRPATLLPVRRITPRRLVRGSGRPPLQSPDRDTGGEPGDRLRREDHLYDFIIEISHNMRPRVAGRGSAVFLHIARPGLAPTAGCVAMPKGRMRQFLKNLGPQHPARHPLIAKFSYIVNAIQKNDLPEKIFRQARNELFGRTLGARFVCATPRRPRIESPDALSPPAPRRGFSFGPAVPKIAEPTRTWVAPNAIAVAKSALIPMESSFSPLRAAILAVEREMRRRRLLERRDAHQPRDRRGHAIRGRP